MLQRDFSALDPATFRFTFITDQNYLSSTTFENLVPVFLLRVLIGDVPLIKASTCRYVHRWWKTPAVIYEAAVRFS